MHVNNTPASSVLIGSPFHRQDIEVFLGVVFLDLPSPVWPPICVLLMNWSLSTYPSIRPPFLRKTWQAQSMGTVLFGPRYHLARPTLILNPKTDRY